MRLRSSVSQRGAPTAEGGREGGEGGEGREGREAEGGAGKDYSYYFLCVLLP